MEIIDTIGVAVIADTSAFTASVAEAQKAMENLGTGTSAALNAAQAPARSFSSALTDAFTGLAVKGRDLDDVVASLGQRLSNMALNVALKPLEQGLTGSIGKLLSGMFADGGVLQAGRVRAFADGGVVSAPTYFPMATGVGLMGEAGAEAILPLARGADGALGVRTEGGGGGTVVNVSVATSDAGSFRRSDAYLSGLIARAVARGQRSL
ncbi:tail protein [Azorhizobium oxalatiphilum]|uniref:Tail protein n=1 Tax=Azorhizobium oxalatiphilum TaxID=980631 RepID=A0A917F644_9HYPH|nr:phage tail tape measure protein [Azorhizobium oxalatiphilum]GGF53200.1 tail protein [Azorhizobium oxalatiphilum]